jgi:hypothetical protein
VYWERDVEKEKDIASKMYAPADEDESDDDLGLDPEGDVDNLVQKEYREDMALRVTELKKERKAKSDEDWNIWTYLKHTDEVDEEGQPVNQEFLNRGALKTIGGAILEALEEREDELQVLARHDIVMSTPTPGKQIVETQAQFDNARGKRVAVYTHDPWESNRTLYGVLVDRNTLDVYINQKGRMVTIPNNFVAGVVLMEYDDDEEEDNDEEYEEGEEYEEEDGGEEYEEEDYDEDEYDEEEYEDDEDDD